MKKLMPLLALAAWSGTALYAQNINATWQGTLKAGSQDLRIVVKISLDNDRLKAVMYSIDQPGPGIPASAISRDGSTIKMAVAALGGTYEGKLAADGNSITGTWTQGQPLPLVLTRATAETAWEIPEPPPPPKMMATEAKPTFEVATIKPSKPEERFSLLINRSGILNTTASSLSDLIKFAYDLHPRQITGGPSWLETEKFDITAKADTPGIPSHEQLKAMLRQLLADRFQLKFHHDSKELSVYAITVSKTGQKLSKNETNPKGLPGFGGGGRGGLRVVNATMAEFGAMMQANVLDRPVVDQTGLGAARWDFILKWTPDPSLAPPGAPNAPAPPAPDADAPPDLFLAMQQQLGLKLEATKAAVDVLVIDRAEKPSAN
jgi:uncharacterized protein (TIGR03435 family)